MHVGRRRIRRGIPGRRGYAFPRRGGNGGLGAHRMAELIGDRGAVRLLGLAGDRLGVGGDAQGRSGLLDDDGYITHITHCEVEENSG